jgi:arylsulfatase A-like enzyme
MSGPPNFLFITTDQQRADHLGCYGNKIVKTSAIDNLAERGLLFEQFYVACPICMPNRVAILTGRMPTINGTRHNGIPLSRDAVTFVDILRAGGYHTGLVGKSHAQNITGHPLRPHRVNTSKQSASAPPDELADAHREQRKGPDYEAELMPLWHSAPTRDEPNLPYYGYEHVRFANGHSDHVQGHYTAWLNAQSGNGDALRGVENALPSPGIIAPQAWRTAVPETLYPTTYIADESCHFIDKHLSTQGDRPFFLHCSFTDPHHPFTPPGKYFDMYSPDDIPLPDSFYNRDPAEPPLLSQLRQEYENGEADGNGPVPFCVGEEEARQIIALTYGMITCVDDAIARLLAHLEAQGIADNTVVIFSSDHGDFMGDHGIMLKHGLHYNGVTRVPFIYVDPDRCESGRSNIPGSSIDTGAIVLARAGLAPYNGFQGIDLIGVQDGEKANPRRGILIEEDELGEHLNRECGVRLRSYIEDNWRITLWDGIDQGEMFNLNTDPLEINNLWAHKEFAEKKAHLTESMLREMIRLNDTAPLATHIA